MLEHMKNFSEIPDEDVQDEILEYGGRGKDPFKKRRLIFEIRRRAEAFKEELKDLIPSNKQLEKLSTHELQQLKEEIKFTIAIHNSGSWEKVTSNQIFHVLEDIIDKNSFINAKGYGNALATNTAFQKTLKEWMLDNMDVFYSDPKWRAGATAVKLLWDTHENNQVIQQHVSMMDSPLIGHQGERMDQELQAIIDEFDLLSSFQQQR